MNLDIQSPMTLVALRRCVIAGLGAFLALASGAFTLPNSFQVTADLPVIASPKTSTVVLQDFAGSLSVEQVLARTQDFQSPESLGQVDSRSHYWILQSFTSQLDTDREFRLDGQWLTIQTHVIDGDQSVTKLKTAGMSAGYSALSDVDPALSRSVRAPSRSSLFTLKKGQTLTLLSRVKSYSTSPPKSFVLRLVDNARYLELRRFGLYIEGGSRPLAGMGRQFFIFCLPELFCSLPAISLGLSVSSMPTQCLCSRMVFFR